MVLTPSANDKVGIFVLRFVVRCWLTYLILRHSHIWDHLKFLKPGLSTAALSEVLMLESSTGSCLDWVSVWVFTNILWHKASYLFMVSSVRCLANSLQGCDRGKPTLLVRRRNTRLLKKDLDINSFFLKRHKYWKLTFWRNEKGKAVFARSNTSTIGGKILFWCKEEDGTSSSS